MLHAMRRPGGYAVRLRQWADAGAALGVEVVMCSVFEEDVRLRPWGMDRLGAVSRGTLPAEALAWSGRRLMRRLNDLLPDVVVVVTLRALEPAVLSLDAPTILDFVDRLSVSYRHRASLMGDPVRALGWRLLATAMDRAESHVGGLGMSARVAAGAGDAAALNATWLPNTVPDELLDGPITRGVRESRGDVDLLFVGTLDYPPNEAAVKWLLSEVWPRIIATRPGTTLRVAGRRPSKLVRRLVAAARVQLLADFDDVNDVMSSARVAVAPLTVAVGIQNKILEAAARGLPQVVTPAATRGFDPAFPLVVAADAPAFADSVVGLLTDEARARALGTEARQHVAEHYSARAWHDTMAALLCA